jgi:hypothetical protein
MVGEVAEADVLDALHSASEVLCDVRVSDEVVEPLLEMGSEAEPGIWAVVRTQLDGVEGAGGGVRQGEGADDAEAGLELDRQPVVQPMYDPRLGHPAVQP